MNELKDIVDNGTTVVTIPTPKGWKCSRKGCKADYMHTHGTYPSLQQKFQYFRENVFHTRGMPLIRLSEKEVRIYLATAGRDVDRAMTALHKGKAVRTRFGTYTAQEI